MNDGASTLQIVIVLIVLALAAAGLVSQIYVLARDVIRENRGDDPR